jgi:S-adenosylmethionine synthetase
MRDTGEYLFTSESVSEGHPDKVADRISDTVLDAFLTADPYSRVACETLVTTNRVVLAGEVRGPASVTPEYLMHLARLAIHEIGYEQDGFHWEKLRASKMPPARPVRAYRAGRRRKPATRTKARATRASCSAMPRTETPDLMPAPLVLQRIKILRRISELRSHRRAPLRARPCCPTPRAR